MNSHIERLDTMARQLRRITERNSAAFDQGFEAATRMVEAGADAQRLREATGVVAIEWADTQPVMAVNTDNEVTQKWERPVDLAV